MKLRMMVPWAAVERFAVPVPVNKPEVLERTDEADQGLIFFRGIGQ